MQPTLFFGGNRTFRKTADGPRVEGVHRIVFVNNGGYFLTLMSVFKDGVIECWHHQLPLAEFADLVRRGRITAQPPDGAHVSGHGLASFHISGVQGIDPEDFIKDLADTIERLNQRPTSVDRARAAWREYLASRTESAKLRLRELYEALPRHLRPFAGEMDGGDYPIRRVLYPDQFPEE
jgi:hypothetical protein